MPVNWEGDFEGLAGAEAIAYERRFDQEDTHEFKEI